MYTYTHTHIYGPGEGNGNPLQYSYLGNLMDRGAWWLQSMLSQEPDMTEQPNHHMALKISVP